MSAVCTRAFSKVPSVSTRVQHTALNALAARDLLPAIVAARAACLSRADGLAVDDGCSGLCFAADDGARDPAALSLAEITACIRHPKTAPIESIKGYRRVRGTALAEKLTRSHTD